MLLLALSACAHLGHLGPSPDGSDVADQMWDEAHRALAAGDFISADSLFTRLSVEYPQTDAGRESVFYLGVIRLDPRNPAWDPAPAEQELHRYLDEDSAGVGTIHRRPEAQTLYELAHQLTMPAESRVPGLQPETRVVTKRVVAPAKESQALADEVADLHRQLDAKDAQIQKLSDELERIRKTLTGTRP
jgi:hypothetical protein